MADWKQIAHARGLTIPDEQLEKITPTLDALEESFGQIAAELPDVLGMAVDFGVEQK